MIKHGPIKTIKSRCLMVIVFCVLFSFFVEKGEPAGESVKDVEVMDSTIVFSQNKFPHVANLCIELKNNGDKNIANLDLEVSYYDKDDYLLKKVVLKNKLTESIPSGEARRYKIALNGDVFNERNEEYPYLRSSDVGEFDVKVLNVKFSRTSKI